MHVTVGTKMTQMEAVRYLAIALGWLSKKTSRITIDEAQVICDKVISDKLAKLNHDEPKTSDCSPPKEAQSVGSSGPLCEPQWLRKNRALEDILDAVSYNLLDRTVIVYDEASGVLGMPLYADPAKRGVVDERDIEALRTRVATVFFSLGIPVTDIRLYIVF